MKHDKVSSDWMLIALMFMVLSLVLLFSWLYQDYQNKQNLKEQICIPKGGGYYTPLTSEDPYAVLVLPLTNMQDSRALVNRVNQMYNPEIYNQLQGGKN